MYFLVISNKGMNIKGLIKNDPKNPTISKLN